MAGGVGVPAGLVTDTETARRVRRGRGLDRRPAGDRERGRCHCAELDRGGRCQPGTRDGHRGSSGGRPVGGVDPGERRLDSERERVGVGGGTACREDLHVDGSDRMRFGDHHYCGRDVRRTDATNVVPNLIRVVCVSGIVPRLVPLIVTVVPPFVVPRLGEIELMDGGLMKRKAPLSVTVPFGVVTETFTCPELLTFGVFTTILSPLVRIATEFCSSSCRMSPLSPP